MLFAQQRCASWFERTQHCAVSWTLTLRSRYGSLLAVDYRCQNTWVTILRWLSSQTELQCTYSAGLFMDCLQSAVPGLQGHCITLQCRFSAPRHCHQKDLAVPIQAVPIRCTAKCSAALQWHWSVTCSAIAVPPTPNDKVTAVLRQCGTEVCSSPDPKQ